MKIEAEIWAVKDGEVTEIKVKDTIFSVKEIEAVEPDKKQKKLEDFIPATTMAKEKPLVKPIGKVVGDYGSNKINQNILNDIKIWMSGDLSKEQIARNIHDIYKPHNKMRSCHALASIYIRFSKGLKPKQRESLDKGEVVGEINSNNIYKNPFSDVKKAFREDKPWKYIRDNILKKYFRNYKPSSLRSITTLYKKAVTHENLLKKPKIFNNRYKPYKPDNAIAKSKSYNVWVTEDDVKKVKPAITKFQLGYKPTFETIKKETGFNENKLRGIIDVMLSEHIVNKVRNEREVVYRLKQ